MRSGCSLCGGGVKEGFHGAKHQRFSTKQRISTFVKQNILISLFGLIIALFCIYLAWTYNKK